MVDGLTDDRLRRIPRHPAGWTGVGMVMLVVMMAVFAPWLSPHDPQRQDLTLRLKPPAWIEGGSGAHLLGTDGLGRDVLSRVIHGSRISLLVSFSAAGLSGVIGVSLGLVAGYFGGAVDGLLSRLGDVQQAIPVLVLAIAAVAMLGPGLLNLLLVLSVTTWINYFRVVRGQVLAVREELYVWAARSLGCSSLRILFRHILPNVSASIIVVGTLLIANMIIFEASLSFLGLGGAVDIPTWGRIVSDGREYISTAWWISFFPGLAISFTVMGINLLGDWLREIGDPRTSVQRFVVGR